MIEVCVKCTELYGESGVADVRPDRLCPRCASVADLLKATEELNDQVRRSMAGHDSTAERLKVYPLIERAQRAVESVRRNL